MNFIVQVEPYVTEADIVAVDGYLRSGGWLTEFKVTQELEQRLAEFLGVPYAVMVTSGTVALYLSLLAHDIGPGDKVLVPDYTMVATINAVSWTGATPVIVDIDPQTMCMNLSDIPIDGSCRALMYMANNGRSGDMKAVQKFCQKHKLILIEDACQALGSTWKGQPLGSFGNAGVFSFTPHKIVSMGQGGAVVTSSEAIYERIKAYKDFGRSAPGVDQHNSIGYNFKFTDIQAALGVSQFKTLEERITRKKHIFAQYQEALADVDGIQFLETSDDVTPWFVDVLLPSLAHQKYLIEALKKQGIGARMFYPPLHHQEIYQSLGVSEDFPVTEDIAPRGVWLPSSMGLETETIKYIAQTVKEVLEEYGHRA